MVRSPFLVARAEVRDELDRVRSELVQRAGAPFDAGKHAKIHEAMRTLWPQLASDNYDSARARAGYEQRRQRVADPARIDRRVNARIPWVVVSKVSSGVLHVADTAVAASLALATRGQVAVYATLLTDAEVCNGGFFQYFLNPAGVLASEATEGFRTLGAHNRAELLTQALARFPGRFAPVERAERTRLLFPNGVTGNPFVTPEFRNDWSPFLSPIEKEYYALNKTERVETICARYIEAHPADFYVDP